MIHSPLSGSAADRLDALVDTVWSLQAEIDNLRLQVSQLLEKHDPPCSYSPSYPGQEALAYSGGVQQGQGAVELQT